MRPPKALWASPPEKPPRNENLAVGQERGGRDIAGPRFMNGGFSDALGVPGLPAKQLLTGSYSLQLLTLPFSNCCYPAAADALPRAPRWQKRLLLRKPGMMLWGADPK